MHYYISAVYLNTLSLQLSEQTHTHKHTQRHTHMRTHTNTHRHSAQNLYLSLGKRQSGDTVNLVGGSSKCVRGKGGFEARMAPDGAWCLLAPACELYSTWCLIVCSVLRLCLSEVLLMHKMETKTCGILCPGLSSLSPNTSRSFISPSSSWRSGFKQNTKWTTVCPHLHM